MVIRGEKSLETLMPEESEITSEKNRDVNRKEKKNSSEMQLNSIIQNKKTKEQKVIYLKTLKRLCLSV